ncbi:MAG: hypothetical protein ABW221_27765 [Vicinamibacteria bacterium]
MAHRSVGAVGRQACAALLAAAGAGCVASPAPAAAPADLRLVERDRFQAVYDGRGRIVRLLQDEDGDGRADAQILYWPNGLPRQGELDTDRDGRVDRWEVFGTDGKLQRIGTAAGGAAAPESWQHLDAQGRVTWSGPVPEEKPPAGRAALPAE